MEYLLCSGVGTDVRDRLRQVVQLVAGFSDALR